MNILEILGKIGFDWQMALANLVNFLIIFFLVSKFLIKPVSKGLNDRYAKINDGLKNAELVKEKLKKAEEDYDLKMQEARLEASRILEEVNSKGNKILNEYKLKAKEESEIIIKETRVSLEKEKEVMINEIKDSSVDMIFEIVEKVLQDKLDKKENEKIINKFLK